MNENNNNFDELKRLLKLKQHEIPPPGYFNNFSGEVVSRIRAGEGGGAHTFAQQIHAQAPWLVSWLRVFETKPGVMGAFATSLCLMLLIGVVLTDRPDPVPTDVLASSELAPDSAPALASIVPAATSDNSGIAVSTNPAVSLQPAATLFGQQPNPLFQSASFTPGQQ
jgi:hypothetical protein